MGRMKRLLARIFRHFYLTHHEGDMSNWNPNDPILKAPATAHETRATLRVLRAGWPGPQIAETLKLHGVQLMQSLQAALDEEGEAHRARRPIHDARIWGKKVTVEDLEKKRKDDGPTGGLPPFNPFRRI